jgi:hypothetical protein
MTGVEQWRPIPGWEGIYEVSSFGRVKSLARTKLGRFNKSGERSILPVRETVRKLWTKDDGYIKVGLCRDSVVRPHVVHRLVCLAFHGPPPFEGAEVAHFDGSRDNNRPDNLRWATKSENYADRWRHGTETAGVGNGNAILTDEAVVHIRKSKMSVNALAALYGVDKGAISAARLGKSWKHVETPPRVKMYNGRQKITPDDVRAIRADPRTSPSVAAEYGLCAGTVQQIRSRKLWPHIE